MIEKGKQNMKDKLKPIGGTGSVQPRNEEESNRQKIFCTCYMESLLGFRSSLFLLDLTVYRKTLRASFSTTGIVRKCRISVCLKIKKVHVNKCNLLNVGTSICNITSASWALLRPGRVGTLKWRL